MFNLKNTKYHVEYTKRLKNVITQLRIFSKIN